MAFVDEIEIVIGSGHGGPGLVSFRRESMTPRGGPDGGDGGKGGDLIVRVSPNLNSLVDFKPGQKCIARAGTPGGSSNSFGPAGENFILIVPPGTVIRDMEGLVIIDMTGKQDVVLYTGGRGGKGNVFFKTSVNQAPEKAQPGEPGTELRVKLELKLIADVGIIGLPNAGKSTLISRISAAKPKIANYPFTTLIPHLGVVKAAEFRSFVVADIPGLIKGAHQGVGLGIQFLRHIERTRLFVHLVDCSSGDFENLYLAYTDIQHELKMYDEMNKDKPGFFPLSNRAQLVVLSKCELVSEDQSKKLKKLFEEKTGAEVFVISAVTGKNIDRLNFRLAEMVLDPQPEADWDR